MIDNNIIKRIQSMDPDNLKKFFCSALAESGITYEIVNKGSVIFSPIIENE